MESRYLQGRRAMKLRGADSPKDKKEKRSEKGEFYSSQIAQAPAKCEECGGSLAAVKAINAAAIVAHIIPKRKNGGCPSVSTHKNNRFYGCEKCHHNFDNKGAAFVQNMSIFEVLKQRVQTFYHLIPESEAMNVPQHFRPDVKKNTHGKQSRKGPKASK